MKRFSGFIRRGAIDRLFVTVLLAERGVIPDEVSSCNHPPAGSPRNFRTAVGREAAAAMVLLAPARASTLRAHLNDRGRELAIDCIGAFPGLAACLSARTLHEIHGHRPTSGPDRMPPVA